MASAWTITVAADNRPREKCTARFCNATRAHADLGADLPATATTPEYSEAIRQASLQIIAHRSATRDKREAELAKTHANLIQREQAITESFTRGDLTPDSYQERAVGLRSRRVEIEELMNRPVVPDDQLSSRIKQTLEVATSLWDLYQPLDESRRNELLIVVFKTIVLAPEGVLGFSLNPPFDQLHKTKPITPSAAADTLVTSLEAA